SDRKVLQEAKGSARFEQIDFVQVEARRPTFNPVHSRFRIKEREYAIKDRRESSAEDLSKRSCELKVRERRTA
ncbi:MAG TPA: hypothetical protein VGI36_17140, partial [Candidatus Binataceae bacterium]